MTEATPTVDDLLVALGGSVTAPPELHEVIAERDEYKRQFEASEKTRMAMAFEAQTLRNTVEHWRGEHDKVAAHKQKIVDRLYKEANIREWCGEFDEAMEELGLDPREREFEIEVTATIEVKYTTSVTATTLKAATELAENHDKVKEFFDENSVSGFDTFDITAVDADY